MSVEDPMVALAVQVGGLTAEVRHVGSDVRIMSEQLTTALAAVADVRVTQADHDARLRSLEDSRSTLERRRPPWTAIGAFIVAAAATLIAYFRP